MLFRRLGAAAYDVLILCGVIMLTSLVVIAARNGAEIPAGSLWFQALILAQSVAYFVGFWASGGQTPGMRPWRLRLVDRSGGTVSPARAVGRLVVTLLVTAPVGAGFVWMLLGHDGRALQDKLSGTDVVDVVTS